MITEPDRPPIRSVCCVLPTYNEAQNIARIVRQLLAVCDAPDLPALSVLVVDDNSPDGTADIVRTRFSSDSRVQLLQGEKRGLGNAYTRGIQHVLDTMDVDAVVQMDADFSHSPVDVPRLLRALEDADVVIGSRYVSGGSIDDTWSPRRRMLSRAGNLFARYVAGLYRVRDCTAGFKAIRTPLLRETVPLRFGVQGYVFQVASLHALHIAGARIVEVPIHFSERVAGTTKLGRRDVLEFFIHVWWLRLLSRKTFIKFGLTGASGVVVNLGAFETLRSLGVNDYLSSAIAIEASIVWNFFLNNFWTFRDRAMSSRKRVRGLKFNAVSVFTLLLSFSTFVLLRWAFPEHPAVFSQLLSIFPAVLANYFLNSYWTFRPDKV